MITLTVQPTDNIQDYLDIIEQNGGGILSLNPVGTFVVANDINIPSNTVLNGNGATINFNNTAYGIKLIGTALNPKLSCSLANLTIMNSTTIGVECEYTDNPILNLFDNVLISNCPIGVSLTNCIAPAFVGTFSSNGVNCTMTDCISFSINFAEFSNATTGDGLVINGCSSATIFNSGFDENNDNGIIMTDCEYITIISNSIYNNGSDGIKLVSGNTAIIVNGNDISDNTANGINVADSTSVKTLIASNTFINNASEVNDNGTSTLVRSNIGVVDN